MNTMRSILAIAPVLLLLGSCGSETGQDLQSLFETRDVKKIRQERDRLAEQQKSLELQLEQIDSVIRRLEGLSNIPLVTITEVEHTDFQHYLQLQGNVKTRANVLVYPEYQGVLQKIYVTEGQPVKKGQILGRIDDGGLSSQLAQLKSQAELARTTFERQKRLWDQKIGSEIQYLQAKTNYESSTSMVEQMESQLGKTTLRAPFDGIVDDVFKDEGTVVGPGPGSEVFRIVNQSKMYVETEVPEVHLPNVTPGKQVEIYFPVLGKSVESRVRQTGSYIDPGNRTFMVEIPVPSTERVVKPNLTAEVKINDYSNPNAVLIPQSIVSDDASGRKYIYLAETNREAVRSVNIPDSIASEFMKVRRQFVTTGLTQGDFIEVLEGLEPGMQVIYEGARMVREGQIVRKINSSRR